MNYVKQMLHGLMNFFQEQRRSGTTTMILKIAKENDVYVLLPNLEMADTEYKEVKGKCVNMQYLRDMTGKPTKPILVDNFTMLELIQKSYNEIAHQEHEVAERHKALLDIKKIIGSFETYNGEIKSK